jgi:hypothetical protein
LGIWDDINGGEKNLGKLWPRLDPETRMAAATAFYRHDFEDGGLQHAQTDAILAGTLKFRPVAFRKLPLERKARSLSVSTRLSPERIFALFTALHFEDRRAVMIRFLDALGIQHDNGLIPPDHEDPTIEPAKLAAAVDDLFANHPADQVALYLATLYLGDPKGWEAIGDEMRRRSAA